MKNENPIPVSMSASAGAHVPEFQLVHFIREGSGGSVFSRSMLEGLRTEMEGRLEVMEVDADAFPGLLVEFRIHRIPSVLLVRAGRVLWKWEGVFSETKFRAQFKHALVSEQEASQTETQSRN